MWMWVCCKERRVEKKPFYQMSPGSLTDILQGFAHGSPSQGGLLDPLSIPPCLTAQVYFSLQYLSPSNISYVLRVDLI